MEMEEQQQVILTEENILKICHKKRPEEVTKINAFAMSITSLLDLSAFVNLKIISLSLNSIKTLKPFEGCLQLKELHLRKNSIERLEEIFYLKDLSELEILFLSDNPCCQTPFYRPKVIRTLKHLLSLDSLSISEGERGEAAESRQELIAWDESVSQLTESSDDLSITQSYATTAKEEEPPPAPALPPPPPQFVSAPYPQTDDQRPIMVPSNALLATRLLLHDLPIDEVKQLMTWCQERLRLSQVRSDQETQSGQVT
jgi:cilla- and flagella-associated protein